MTDVDKPSPKGVAASGSRLFARDVGCALVVWARDPRLPVAAMAIAMLSAVPLAIDATIGPSGIGLVSFVVFGALAGFYGTERVWFVFVDRGLPFTWREFRVLNGRLRSRYIRLGVLAVCLFVVPAVPISVLAHNGTTAEITATSIVVVLFDIAFTFATIGLAFNDGPRGRRSATRFTSCESSGPGVRGMRWRRPWQSSSSSRCCREAVSPCRRGSCST